MSNEESERLVWAPYPPPSHSEKPHGQATITRRIHIKHPNYECPLLTFPLLDATGIHHETVRVACAILADNRWDGFLSRDKHGEQPVPESEIILKAPEYYFQSPPQLNDSNYALTPTFGHWRFPHDDGLPPSWREIISFAQSSRPDSDSSCRITQCDDGVEDAHLIPTAERRWFNSNNMAQYIASTRIDKMKDPDNSVRLRSDIHTVFDAKRFAIVPIEGRLVAYCRNSAPVSQLNRLYHGVELHRISDPGYLAQFLFARFAYTVFQSFRTFLEVDLQSSRKLRLRVGEQMGVEWCNAERCWRFAQVTARQGKSGSSSPRKRPHSGAGAADDGGHDYDYYDSYDYDDDDDDDDESDEAEPRGRKRRRTRRDDVDAAQSVSSSPPPSSIDCSTTLSITTPKTLPFPATKVRNIADVDQKELEADRHKSSS